MTPATPTPAVDLERRLATAAVHLDHIAHHLAGPAVAPDLVAGAYETLASLAQVKAVALRGEVALR